MISQEDKLVKDQEVRLIRAPLFSVIALAGQSRDRWKDTENTLWKNRWDSLLHQCEQLLPSGSGIDRGTRIIRASRERIDLELDYHHMNSSGFYTGWTRHVIIVRPCLINQIQVLITGPNKTEIKDYLYDLYDDILRREVGYHLQEEPVVKFTIPKALPHFLREDR